MTKVVLVVEDEPALASIFRRALEQRGYSVLTAADGREALRLVDQAGNRVDLLLSDIVMPGIGGRELVWHLRARIPDLRVILASGYTDAGGALQMMEEDEDMIFVSKPVDLRVLLDLVEDTIGGSEEE
jgi:two-component system cell cycle sensor histidine kinase/response regulator CckA